MKALTLKKILIGLAGIFAVSFYTPAAFSQLAPGCLESCLDLSPNQTYGCCIDTDFYRECSLEEYCQDQCACGNGAIDTTCGNTEQCDDDNNQSGDGCDQGCMNECGNGYIDGNEQCDDGNTASGDGCDSTCHIEEIVVGNPPPPLAKFSYKNVEYLGTPENYLQVYEAAVADFKIKPNGPTTIAMKGVRFDGPSDMRISVIGKQALAVLEAHLNDLLNQGYVPEGTYTTFYAAHPVCAIAKNAYYAPGTPFATPGKGCRETPYSEWAAAGSVCTVDDGCCSDPNRRILSATGTLIGYKSPTDTSWNKNYTCKVLPSTYDSTGTRVGYY